ncbi:hypothetical protein CQW49_09585 [Methylosinus trichosporium OB3b]|uniref:Precorrin-3B synthase n=1 Tax=Methylosinus trichosporium (strain ATCC 35070 / NCIMB 11131 / UNIQEM 75 / OB3b) TaxID=595536 RepID=A0A2D2CZC7_METT3|nr:hypothetical protein CQW49_09585 [Methylosinus trichosporium OB3b]
MRAGFDPDLFGRASGNAAARASASRRAAGPRLVPRSLAADGLGRRSRPARQATAGTDSRRAAHRDRFGRAMVRRRRDPPHQQSQSANPRRRRSRSRRPSRHARPSRPRRFGRARRAAAQHHRDAVPGRGGGDGADRRRNDRGARRSPAASGKIRLRRGHGSGPATRPDVGRYPHRARGRWRDHPARGWRAEGPTGSNGCGGRSGGRAGALVSGRWRRRGGSRTHGGSRPPHRAAGWSGSRRTAPAAEAPTPGPVPDGYLVGFPFGAAPAAALQALGRLGDVRVTPWRMLAVETSLAPPALEGVLLAADPVLQVSACSGAPFCPQAAGPTRDLARALAPAVPVGAHLHVAGCAKGCAHAAPADLTIVATPRGYDLVVRGAAADGPRIRDLRPADFADGALFEEALA